MGEIIIAGLMFKVHLIKAIITMNNGRLVSGLNTMQFIEGDENDNSSDEDSDDQI